MSLEIEYNSAMPRAALLTLLVISVLSGSLQAQRGGAAFHGGGAGRPFGSGFGGRSGFSNRSFSHGFFRDGYRNGNFGSYFLPFDFVDEPVDQELPDFEGAPNGHLLPPVIRRAPEPPLPKGQFIEIPASEKLAAAKVLPPTIFILANGERLETKRFVLTASLLTVRIGRQQRTIPLQMLNIDATVTTNHERGIDLQVPDDRNEISLSF